MCTSKVTAAPYIRRNRSNHLPPARFCYSLTKKPPVIEPRCSSDCEARPQSARLVNPDGVCWGIRNLQCKDVSVEFGEYSRFFSLPPTFSTRPCPMMSHAIFGCFGEAGEKEAPFSLQINIFPNDHTQNVPDCLLIFPVIFPEST